MSTAAGHDVVHVGMQVERRDQPRPGPDDLPHPGHQGAVRVRVGGRGAGAVFGEVDPVHRAGGGQPVVHLGHEPVEKGLVHRPRRAPRLDGDGHRLPVAERGQPVDEPGKFRRTPGRVAPQIIEDLLPAEADEIVAAHNGRVAVAFEHEPDDGNAGLVLPWVTSRLQSKP